MFNSDQKRAFIAVLLSGIVLFGWQYYFSSKPVAGSTIATTNTVATTNEAGKVETNTVAATPINPTIDSATLTIKDYTLSSPKSNYTFSNDLVFKNTSNDSSLFGLDKLSGSNQTLKIQIISDYGPTDLVFVTTEVTPTKLTATNEKFGVTYTSSLDDLGRLVFNMNSSKPYKYRFIFNAKETKLDNGQHRQFITYDSDVTFFNIPKDKEKDGSLKWVGVDFNYHLFALVFKNKEVSKIKTTEQGNMFIELVNPTKDFAASLVYSKKNYDQLIAIGNPGDNLHLSVDFGFFAILAVPILRGLQFIHKYIPNYGIAIILLTILIRLITFPLQYKSFKSMKKMQLIQPELAKIKEKYKDDSQKMQKETMALFQKAGANPLSGCLPLLLQMPFFFAIYRVLFSAVELVGAPFYGWIHDLSIHDPFYILPILMAGSMFLQQKMTPQTSVDPTQQKIMMFMPLIFGFIMKSLPAGLVLYIFVSTMVGILQQYMVYKSVD